jgi:hypothetical protein
MRDFEFVDPQPKLPQRVIIDMADEVTRLKNTIESLEYLGFDIESVIAAVFDEVHKDSDAEHNLCVSNHEMESDCADTELAADVSVYIAAREEFSRKLLMFLRDYKMYLNGVLYYQLSNVMGGFLKLEKLSYAITEDMKRVRNVERAVHATQSNRTPGYPVEGGGPAQWLQGQSLCKDLPELFFKLYDQPPF